MAEADSTSCAHCGDSFVKKRRSAVPQLYCSTRCRDAAKYKRRVETHGRGWKKAHPSYGRRYKTPAYKKKQPVFTCKACGVLFLPLPGKGYGYCSDACHPNKCTYKPTIAFCDGCGSAFITKRATDRYCNRDCQGRSKSTCSACGADFYATRNSLGKYCSIACSLPQTHAARRLTRREKEDAWRERNQGKTCRVSIKPCICCERELVGPRPARAWAGKFCRCCKDALGSSVGSNVGRIDLLRAKLTGRKCEICGIAFIPLHDRTTTCSSECQKQTDRAREARQKYIEAFRKTEAYKRKKRIQNRTRRARKYGNGPVDQIDPIEILERDGWRCYVCGVYTPKKLRGHLTDPRAPVMDHVIPLAAGGTHTLDNVACCCAKCNTEKGHEIYQGDMFIGGGARPHPNGG